MLDAINSVTENGLPGVSGVHTLRKLRIPEFFWHYKIVTVSVPLLFSVTCCRSDRSVERLG